MVLKPYTFIKGPYNFHFIYDPIDQFVVFAIHKIILIAVRFLVSYFVDNKFNQTATTKSFFVRIIRVVACFYAIDLIFMTCLKLTQYPLLPIDLMHRPEILIVSIWLFIGIIASSIFQKLFYGKLSIT